MKQRGFGLVVALITLAVTTILAAAAASVVKVLLRDSLYQQRLLQAQLIAESGAEAALSRLTRDGAWREGFKREPFAGGYYDVTLSSGAIPTVTATGYSAALLPFGRAHRTVRFAAEILPVPQMRYAAQADDPLFLFGNLQVNGYDSAADPSPKEFGSGADVLTNKSIGISGPTPMVFGRATYLTGGEPPPGAVTGGIVKGRAAVALPYEDGSAYLDQNDNRTGISPPASYDSRTRSLIVGSTTTASIRSGVYYLRELRVWGRLTAQITDGPVVIFLDGPLTVMGGFLNDSLLPGNLVLYGQGNPGTWSLAGSNAVQAVLLAPKQNLVLAQAFYGAVAARQITITRPLHYDAALSRPKAFATRVVPGTWTSL